MCVVCVRCGRMCWIVVGRWLSSVALKMTRSQHQSSDVRAPTFGFIKSIQIFVCLHGAWRWHRPNGIAWRSTALCLYVLCIIRCQIVYRWIDTDGKELHFVPFSSAAQPEIPKVQLILITIDHNQTGMGFNQSQPNIPVPQSFPFRFRMNSFLIENEIVSMNMADNCLSRRSLSPSPLSSLLNEATNFKWIIYSHYFEFSMNVRCGNSNRTVSQSILTRRMEYL